MKDINKLKNYRLKYKRYYNIDFDDTYDVHHIDFNHNNNDIDNLILLPKALHSKYHFCLGILGCPDGKLEFNAKINVSFEDSISDYLIILGNKKMEDLQIAVRYEYSKQKNRGEFLWTKLKLMI